METNGLLNLSAVNPPTSDDKPSGRKMIAQNFDTFLQLLTTQLRNQNPLEPLDTNEFTNQLVQFSSVEQIIETNKHLEQISQLSATNMAAASVSYIGKTVIADGATQNLENGQANWFYEIKQDAPQSTMIIRDANGNTVSSQNVALKTGRHKLTWNGQDTNGRFLPEGRYTLQLSAKNQSGARVRVTTSIAGQVDSVDLSKQDPVLNIGESRIKLSEIKQIGTAPDDRDADRQLSSDI